MDEVVRRSMDIIADYGEYLEQHPVSVEVVDETALPHKKTVILDAICIGLLTQPNTELREALISTALRLANFQPNIGKKPLCPLGFDPASLEMSNLSPEELMNKFDCGIEARARYEAQRPDIQKEVLEIGDRIRKANRAFNEMRAKHQG